MIDDFSYSLLDYYMYHDYRDAVILVLSNLIITLMIKMKVKLVLVRYMYLGYALID